MENDLAISMGNSISENACNITSNFLEVPLDYITKNDTIKGVPIISTAISAYKIGRDILSYYYIKKLNRFVYELNNQAATEEDREYYKHKILDNPQKRNKELEYILVLIARYLNTGRAEKLASLYLAYLDGKIDWCSFTKYAEVLDRLMPGDLEELKNGDQKNVDDNAASDALLRLVSLGLVISHTKGATAPTTLGEIVIPPVTVKDYELTSFGKRLLFCLRGIREN